MIELSVIIPTCNRGDLLQQAVMSVVAQQLANYEIIIVDDSTAPQQPLFLQQLMVSAPIRYVVNNGAHGAANARNFGVKQAQGAFITFLDDDDLYMPGRLHNMLQVMRSGDYVFVSSGRFYQLNDFNSVQQVPRQLQGVVSLTDIYQANDIDIGFMLKRDTFLALKGFDNSFKNLEDWDFVIRMASLGNGYKCSRLDYCVNISTERERVSNNDWVGYLQILERYEQRFGKNWAAF
ncbi:MAG: glycosyltransferase, partial [Paraglaciecola sp.]|nr:glycosyltransferase [Paraglaciecola sp.]